MNIAFLGYGQVGSALADQLQKTGHAVSLAASDPSSTKLQQALARNPKLTTLSPKEAVSKAQVVFLATPFHANEATLKAVAVELEGKILVDCTNPVGPNLSHGLNSLRSGSELVQELVPKTEVVKAFTIYGYENFEDNSFPLYGVKPAMLFCGRDANAKEMVSELIRQLGWEPIDVGGLEQALHLEHMTLLWVRMVRTGGRSPHMVWAMLTK